MERNVISKNKINKNEYSNLSNAIKFLIKKNKSKALSNKKIIYFFRFIIIIIFIIILKKEIKSIFKKSNDINNKFIINDNNNENSKEKIEYDKFDVDKFNEIKEKYLKARCSEMWDNQSEFINGIIRKNEPKKLLEIGVRNGGSSIVLLNAINDMQEAKLYSIDISSEEFIGKCVNKNFPEFLPKWTLFKGNMANEFIEK